ncbi:CDP-glycerol glycerophosphotransferase family protein [Aequorivita capsosiphonis]|uniref:CDP-glycerol glycerophosphotransferase family protein n=1 Tax=Aequorivita capsosiphonis TaxID=487317 RepID=UPI0003F6675E|nr:CDP-glycerol glycerophosphotransferase family protein [Aequorivita capsosiphonis]
MNGKHKIAIIFLDEIHHIYHFVSVAVELAKNNEVHILTHPASHKVLHDSLKTLHGENVIVENLPTASFRAFTDKLKGRSLPRKGFWIKKYQSYILNNFDAVIFTDYFHHYLLKARGNRNIKFIFTQHGTPGRAYAYSKDTLDFDFLLLCGKFHYENLKSLDLLKSDHKITGYPKFDALEKIRTDTIFSNSKPTVLYNPHFSPPFSSWHFNGPEVLEFFYNSNQYNLIFAPHINLFNKVGGDNSSVIPKKYFTAENFYIDLGSEKSVNMTYVNQADIYLGDVSSQVFEYMVNPRPCIFLNPENIEFKDDINYRFWKCGDVISATNELEDALKNASKNFEEKYKPIQEKMNSENYYTQEGSTASERASKAITEYLDRSL